MLAEINELKVLRKRHNLTQNQLAKLAGVSQSLIAKTEAGLIDLSYSNFRKIHDTLAGIGEKKEPKAGDILNRKIIAVNKSEPLSEAVKKMRLHGISQMPVMESQNIVGLLAETDVIESIHLGKDIKKMKVADAMQTAPPSVPDITPLRIVTELLRVSPLVVITQKGNALGVLTKSDILNKLAR